MPSLRDAMESKRECRAIPVKLLCKLLIVDGIVIGLNVSLIATGGKNLKLSRSVFAVFAECRGTFESMVYHCCLALCYIRTHNIQFDFKCKSKTIYVNF